MPKQLDHTSASRCLALLFSADELTVRESVELVELLRRGGIDAPDWLGRMGLTHKRRDQADQACDLLFQRLRKGELA